jgi:hypothetical protein
MSHAGTYDKQWEDSRAPLYPLNYDERFCRQAPVEQQINRVLAAGDTIETVNLSPRGRMVVAVPRVQVNVRAVFTDGDMDAPAVLDTVAIESDGPLIRFVWRACMECHGREDRLKSSLVRWRGESNWREGKKGEV